MNHQVTHPAHQSTSSNAQLPGFGFGLPSWRMPQRLCRCARWAIENIPGLGVPLNKPVEKKDGTGDKGIFTGSGGMQAQGINLFLKRFYIQIGMIYMYINTVYKLCRLSMYVVMSKV